MQGESVKITAQDLSDKPGTNPALTVKEAQAVATTTAATTELAASSTVKQEMKPGWNILPPEELPRPTYWPVIMALAITLLCFGVVTTVLISIIGIVLFFISLIGWIGDLQNEQHGEH